MHNQPRGHKLPKEPGNWNETLVWVEFAVNWHWRKSLSIPWNLVVSSAQSEILQFGGAVCLHGLCTAQPFWFCTEIPTLCHLQWHPHGTSPNCIGVFLFHLKTFKWCLVTSWRWSQLWFTPSSTFMAPRSGHVTNVKKLQLYYLDLHQCPFAVLLTLSFFMFPFVSLPHRLQSTHSTVPSSWMGKCHTEKFPT